MARRSFGVRVHTTLAASLVVAVVLGLASAFLVRAVRTSLETQLEETVTAQVGAAAARVAAGGPEALALQEDPSQDWNRDDHDTGEDGDDDSDEPDDEIVEVRDPSGDVVASTQSGYRIPFPDHGGETGAGRSFPGAEHHYVLEVDTAVHAGTRYTVLKAVSEEEIDDSVAALQTGLWIGVPVVLLFLAGTIWLVAGRALRPVERIRAQVASITDDRLDRRVPEPGSRDAIGRLARTMNAMLGRLESSRDQQVRFVSDASHELRSPIATLRQSAEVALAHPDAFEAGEFEAIVAEEAVRMQHLVDQLLLLTRTRERGPGAASEVDLDDLVLAEADRLRRSGLTVDTRGVVAVRAHADPTAWAQALRNLADNAARHASSRVSLTLAPTGSGVRVSVSDDGSGISPADRERVFDRFVRLDEARSRDAGGSGLGLAIVRDLVTALGGRVWVREGDLGGAEFVVEVPMTDR